MNDRDDDVGRSPASGDPHPRAPHRPLHGDRPVVGQLPVAEDVRKEVAFHIEMRAAELVEEGWSADDARREAERIFGNRNQIEEECRDVTHQTDRQTRRAHTFDGLREDLKFAFRTLVRAPGFAVVAVLTLALGIGANAAIFSVVNGVLLQPLPYPEPGEIVWVAEHQPERGNTMSVAWQNFVDWHEQSRSFEALAATSGGGQVVVLGAERPYRTGLAQVTEGFWPVLRPVPVAGRLLSPEEHAPGGPPAVVIREDLWRSVYNGRPLDQIRMEVAGTEPLVVGVLPTDFDFPNDVSIWAALNSTNTSRSAHNYRVIGRLAPGASLAQADAELDAVQNALVEGETDDEFLASAVQISTLREQISGSARRPLLLLLGAAGLVLLIACTNLASTLLARGTARTREIAVRSAIGAGRGRIVRQLLTESLVLAALGAGGGLLLAAGAVRAIKSLSPDSVPRLDAVGLDPMVLGFTAFVALVTAVLFGLYPALRQTGEEVATSLRTGTRQNSSGGRGRAWGVLVVAEVALAVLLLTGAGLLVRSFQELLDTERGFDTEGVMTAGVALSRARYPDMESHREFYRELLASLEAHPEIASVGVVNRAPLLGAANGRIQLDGDLSRHAVALYQNASGGYFEAVGIELLRGRLFDEGDREDTEHVAIVSESFADEYWPGENPVGRTITGGGMDSFWQEGRFARVVGVVSDASYLNLERGFLPTVYFPYTQRPQRLQYSATIVARTMSEEASSLVAPLRQTITAMDSDALPTFRSMEELVADTTTQRVFTTGLLTAFAVLALVLAVVGIYGVVSYTVTRRTREMGIRLALGARPKEVGRMVRGKAMATVFVGAVLGVGGSLLLVRVLESLLYGVTAFDLMTLGGSVAVLFTAAWLAATIPARRATRVDPLITMQAE